MRPAVVGPSYDSAGRRQELTPTPSPAADGPARQRERSRSNGRSNRRRGGAQGHQDGQEAAVAADDLRVLIPRRAEHPNTVEGVLNEGIGQFGRGTVVDTLPEGSVRAQLGGLSSVVINANDLVIRLRPVDRLEQLNGLDALLAAGIVSTMLQDGFKVGPNTSRSLVFIASKLIDLLAEAPGLLRVRDGSVAVVVPRRAAAVSAVPAVAAAAAAQGGAQVAGANEQEEEEQLQYE